MADPARPFLGIGGGAGGPAGGVESLAAEGEAALTGAVTLSEGDGVTLTQVGQDIEIAAAATGKRIALIGVFDPATALATGDAKQFIMVPTEMNGMVLTEVAAAVSTVSSSGTPTVALRRERAGVAVDMLSTNITIDANEKTSYSADVPPVINASNDDVATGDLIYVDVDAVGTGAVGLTVALTFT